MAYDKNGHGSKTSKFAKKEVEQQFPAPALLRRKTVNPHSTENKDGR